MGLTKEYIQEFLENDLKYPMHGKLSIGTMERFREGVRDFSEWASGVIQGPIPWITDRLATVMSGLGIKSLDVEPARNYGWQRSDLEGFCYRIQALLPDGTLAGYYLGRVGDDSYAAFGHGIVTSETACPSVSASARSPKSAPASERVREGPGDEIHFSCAQCSKKVKAPVRYCGKQAKCPACGAIVTVPPATRSGQSARGSSQQVGAPKVAVSGDFVAELVSLCHPGNPYGEATRQRVREIGAMLDQKGGFEEMRRVHEEVGVRGGRMHARILEGYWGGIGDWLS
jgi:hypothetical protein